MKVYTKKGDGGETGLWGGSRVLKSSIRVEAYGEVDELLSVLGVLQAKLEGEEKEEIQQIQVDLFNICNELADPKVLERPGKKDLVVESDIQRLEEHIDRMEEKLPPLKSFILPGGDELAALFQLARTVCRRAERRCVQLHQSEPLRPQLLAYLNRLSDLLFVWGRWRNFITSTEELMLSELRKKRKQ